MSLDISDSKTYQRCEGYINKFYENRLERTVNNRDIIKLLSSELLWHQQNIKTYTWCKAYIKKYSKGGSNIPNSRKRQSKRKDLRLRKVSKKY